MGAVLTELAALDQSLGELTHPLLGRASVHASVTEGAVEMSSCPARCTLGLERRTLPGEQVERELGGLLDRCRTADATSRHRSRPCSSASHSRSLRTRSLSTCVVKRRQTSAPSLRRSAAQLLGRCFAGGWGERVRATRVTNTYPGPGPNSGQAPRTETQMTSEARRSAQIAERDLGGPSLKTKDGLPVCGPESRPLRLKARAIGVVPAADACSR